MNLVVRLYAEQIGGTGTSYFDRVRAELGQTTVSARGTRILCGEWKAS